MEDVGTIIWPGCKGNYAALGGISESVLTDGKVDVKKVKPITFDPFNNAYHVVGTYFRDI